MGGKVDVDPLRAAALALREKNGLPHGVAKLETAGGDGDRVDYFRGKDLVRYLREHPDKFSNVLKDKTERAPEESAAELVRAFMMKGLANRTERKFKRPKPGRTRLVKWPRTILPVKDQVWDEPSFYAWTFDRPKGVLYYITIALIPLVVIAACLFPLAPWWARMALVYFLMSILLVLLGLIVLRYTLFTLVWVASGHALWLFPNMMSDQVSIVDAFVPVVTFDKAKSWKNGWQARIATAAVCAGVVWLLASHTPDLDHLKQGAAQAHDSLFEYLDQLYSKDKTYLTSGSGAGGPGAPGGPGAQSGGPGSGQQFRGRPGDGMGGRPGGV
mmetsp:Transcript_28913/g.73837  ORF Transcript_28913/g.73837 Transcript_28913/m.73837 type:complete len:329 (-) Transcript_28913:168-1154(-)